MIVTERSAYDIGRTVREGRPRYYLIGPMMKILVARKFLGIHVLVSIKTTLYGISLASPTLNMNMNRTPETRQNETISLQALKDCPSSRTNLV